LDHIPALLKLKSISPSSPLKYIVSIDEIPEQATSLLNQWSSSVGVKVLDFKQFEQLGQACLVDPIPARREQVASICYTSGTTGNPKGVVLTHVMLAMAVQSNLCGLTFDGEAVLLSYLPLAHIYERLCAAATFAVAGRVGYFSGDHLRLLEDAQILKPTFFPSVPRVLNRIYQAAMVVAESPGIRGALFRKAMSTKLANLHANGEYKHAFWDKLVFRKIRAVLGGNIELIVSGSAPVSRDVMEFLKIAFACNVQEGYGMTENCATCNRSYSDDPTGSGTVGPPQPCNEIKLVDVPEMGYTSEDQPRPRGEVCVRGANCFSLYYKDEANTNKAMDSEGWLHTGDVGELDDCGRLRIIDRVKNIMKLAQGEYVALEKIENIYSANSLIQQLYIHGDGLQSYLVAVVVPDPVQLAAGLQSLLNKKVDPTQDLAAFDPYLQDPVVVQWVLGVLNAHAKKNGLKGFEMVKRIHLTSSLFSVEDGTMTPTMKIKRKDAHMKFKRQIDQLYSLGDPIATVITKL
jgi:long-chain acyl-CoA synthetase